MPGRSKSVVASFSSARERRGGHISSVAAGIGVKREATAVVGNIRVVQDAMPRKREKYDLGGEEDGVPAAHTASTSDGNGNDACLSDVVDRARLSKIAQDTHIYGGWKTSSIRKRLFSFSKVITALQVCMYVCMVITYSRVWINRVRLPILLVVSCKSNWQ